MQQQQQQQSAAGVDKEFNRECLEAHNDYRQLHGTQPLTMSPKLALSAQSWANHLAGMGKLQHSTPNPKGSYGENIAMKMIMGSQEYKGSQCTAQWYSEIEMYNFNGGENQMDCGHFSQVVWKGTQEAGFGKAISPDGKMFAVGQYSPPGNFMNKWQANIAPPVSGTIQVPTREDIMGKSAGGSQPQQHQHRQQPQSLTIGGHGQLGQSGGSDPEPQPADPRDRPVGKATKTRTVNNEKTVTVTVTFARPDGSRYQVTKDTASQRESQQTSKAPPPSKPQEQLIQPARFRRNFAAPPTSARDDVDGAADDEREAFADEAVRQQNRLRRRHGAPELRRSDSLDRLAQAWAEKLSESRDLRHCRPADYADGRVGQNIAKRPAGEGGHPTTEAAQQLTQQWYGESHRFPFGQPDPGDIVGGHFSQLVWCSSEKLGIGQAVDSQTGDTYVACFYYPCGNLSGQFADNVLPNID